jgi:PhnB protein
MSPVNPIPPNTHTITPGLIVKGGKKAIQFYKDAFGAKELQVMLMPDGQGVMHAELKIGDSKFYVNDEFPDQGGLSPQTIGGTPVSLNIYTEDCDAMIARATAAGAKVVMPAADMFWGDRMGALHDPFGHKWSIMTHKEDVSPAEMEKRGREFMSASAKK